MIVPDESLFYTKVLATFNDGSSFEGNEVQVSLVVGFTANFRKGLKELLFIDGIPRIDDTY